MDNDTARDPHTETMHRAFDVVKNPAHWKAPVEWRWVEADYERELRRRGVTEAQILEAIGFFTATAGRVERPGDGFVYIKAAGYWAGPAC